MQFFVVFPMVTWLEQMILAEPIPLQAVTHDRNPRYIVWLALLVTPYIIEAVMPNGKTARGCIERADDKLLKKSIVITIDYASAEVKLISKRDHHIPSKLVTTF